MVETGTTARRFLALCLAGAAAAQFVAAVVFFFAANWWLMAPGLKTGLVGGLMLACAAAAALAAPASPTRSVCSVAGAVLSGILFAVHGQIWQTGADAWELFALWAAFALLWAVTIRQDAVWLTAAIIATIAAGTWVWRAVPEATLPDHWAWSAVSLAPLLVMVLRRAVALLPGAVLGPWLEPVLLAMAAIVAGVGALAGMEDSLAPVLTTLSICCAVLVIARPARFGPWPFALTLIVAVVLAEALLLNRLMAGDGGDLDNALKLLLAAGLMLTGVGGVAWMLKRLFAPAAQPRMARLAPLLSVAIGVGAWFAAAVAAAGWIGLVHVLGLRGNLGLSLAAFAGVIAALGAWRWRQPGSFGYHVQAAFATLTYGALIGAAVEYGESLTITCWAAVLLLPVLLAVSANAAAGTAATITALVGAGWLLYDHDPAAALALTLIAAALGGGGLTWERPSIRAGAVVLLLGAFVIPGTLEFAHPELAMLCRGTAAIAAAGLLAATLSQRRDLREPRLLGAGGLMLVGSLMVPAGGAGLVGLTAASPRAIGRPLIALGFAAAAWSVIRFYYLLEVPLAEKAGWLAVGGAIAAAALILLSGLPRAALRLRPSAVAVLACAALPIALEVVDARAKGAIVADGRQVLLPLRPVDPRSLVQGDFMALRYEDRLTKAGPGPDGLIVLRLDADGVAREGRSGGATGAPDEVVVKVRAGRDEMRLAPDSFLFEEGSGAEWAKARFAIVRISGGELVLTGLADAGRRAIVP